MSINQQYCIINAAGQIVSLMQGTDGFITTNLSKDQFAILSDVPTTNSYWDFNLKRWVIIPPAPDNNYSFDYHTKTWINLKSLNEIKELKWLEIKSERDLKEYGGFEFEGNIYDSDLIPQGRILGAALANLPQEWTLADNTTVLLSAVQLNNLYKVMQSHITDTHVRGRIAREAINAALTKEEVNAVIY